MTTLTRPRSVRSAVATEQGARTKAPTIGYNACGIGLAGLRRLPRTCLPDVGIIYQDQGSRLNSRSGYPQLSGFAILHVADAAARDRSASPVANAQRHNLVRPSDSQRSSPISPDTAQASCCIACANDA